MRRQASPHSTPPTSMAQANVRTCDASVHLTPQLARDMPWVCAPQASWVSSRVTGVRQGASQCKSSPSMCPTSTRVCPPHPPWKLLSSDPSATCRWGSPSPPTHVLSQQLHLIWAWEPRMLSAPIQECSNAAGNRAFYTGVLTACPALSAHCSGAMQCCAAKACSQSIRAAWPPSTLNGLAPVALVLAADGAEFMAACPALCFSAIFIQAQEGVRQV